MWHDEQHERTNPNVGTALLETRESSYEDSPIEADELLQAEKEDKMCQGFASTVGHPGSEFSFDHMSAAQNWTEHSNESSQSTAVLVSSI